MMVRNVDNLAEGRELVEQAMRELVDLLVEFNAAVRKFGKKGWLKRAFKMQSHVKTLGRLDKRVVAQLQRGTSTGCRCLCHKSNCRGVSSSIGRITV